MNRPLLLLYGVTLYLFFNATFLYFAGFLSDLWVPKAINDGAIGTLPTAFSINILLVFLFGFFHSLMARERFKRWWVRIVSPEAERSTYVLQASVFLALLMWQWQPIPITVWHVDGALGVVIHCFFVAGILLVLIATFLINHFELFGLQQVWLAQSGSQMPDAEFVTPFLYRIVRHPMQLGVLIMLYAAPHMTVGHLLLAISMTLYILIGLYFEERSLVRAFGGTYRQYQSQVPMLLPRPDRILRADPTHQTIN